jgi:hypothetical protein
VVFIPLFKNNISIDNENLYLSGINQSHAAPSAPLHSKKDTVRVSTMVLMWVLTNHCHHHASHHSEIMKEGPVTSKPSRVEIDWGPFLFLNYYTMQWIISCFQGVTIS